MKLDYTSALLYIEQALTLDKKIENSQGIAKDIYAMGIIYEHMELLEQAYIYFKKSVLIYETLTLADEVIKTLKKLEEIARRLLMNEEAEIWKNTRIELEANK